MKLKHLAILLPLTLLLSSCGWNVKELFIRTAPVEKQVLIQVRPKPITMNGVQWYVVTYDQSKSIDHPYNDRFRAFLKDLETRQGAVVWYAITPKDYGNMGLNFEEMRRYIRQQNLVIVYYEEALRQQEKKTVKKD
jgi:hypothetical protein